MNQNRGLRGPARGQPRQRNAPTADADQGQRPAAPPKMRRSTSQLASSYAPMRHFAFENGLGVCLATPLDSPAMTLSGNTPDQIHRRLREAARAWFVEGEARLDGGNAARADLLRHLIVDDSLYDPGNRTFEYRRHVFGFVEPKKMGYEVAPTTLVCGTCGLLRPTGSARRMAEFLEQADQECQDPGRPSPSASRCRWRQFEPIFVHPSGAWKSVDVAPMDVVPGNDDPARRSVACEACGWRQFKVDMSKVTLSGWFLKCAKCGVRASWSWTDNDEDYLRAQARAGTAGLTWNPDENRMEKISYGAAIAYVPQSETFVDLPHADVLRLIEAQHEGDLGDFVGMSSGYLADAPSPEEAAAELEKGGEEAQRLATRIRRSLATAEALKAVNEQLAAEQLAEAQATVREACDRKFLRLAVQLPPDIRAKIAERTQRWASRYDPFQLAIEHEALAATKLAAREEEGSSRRSFVRFSAPDARLVPWEEGTDEARQAETEVKDAFQALGIAEAGLIPRFELCRFTYGYSRTSSGPIHPKREVPVRLKLFPKVRVGDHADTVHPVYVMRQKNEAFYFRLDTARVHAWLERLGCQDGALLTNEPSLKAALFMSAHPMDRFLTEHDRSSGTAPRLYAAAYGLVHSMAHHVIRTMSRLSGLDEGGLGEYLFPTDLAFVIYRSGMTMDLGDLSSLWRNSWRAFLAELRAYPESLGCNVGSLCAEQGAACPDCLMIPEVVCVAGNRYLSRSLLTGEGRPSFMDVGARRITGYLELARGGGDGAG